MGIKEKKIAVLIENMYEDLEAWYPYYRLKEEGAKVLMVGPERDRIYNSKHGYPAKAEQSVKEINADEFDGVIIPGGYAPDYMRRDPRMVQFVKDVYETGGFVAAICHGGWMLCSADIIRDRKVTGFFSIKDDLVNAGGRYMDTEVVSDDGIITSRKPEDLPFFMRTIIESLSREMSRVV